MDWLYDRLTGWLIDWLIDCFFLSFTARPFARGLVGLRKKYKFRISFHDMPPTHAIIYPDLQKQRPNANKYPEPPYQPYQTTDTNHIYGGAPTTAPPPGTSVLYVWSFSRSRPIHHKTNFFRQNQTINCSNSGWRFSRFVNEFRQPIHRRNPGDASTDCCPMTSLAVLCCCCFSGLNFSTKEKKFLVRFRTQNKRTNCSVGNVKKG